eukprot:Hpha_TRINITY_DN13650_c0_g1::TRINITY_DN13650_c0_g1_i7::g.122520::m.122520
MQVWLGLVLLTLSSDPDSRPRLRSRHLKHRYNRTKSRRLSLRDLKTATVEDKDDCEWDGMELIGRCFTFGVKPRDVESAEQCKRRCCGAGNACVSWQWREDVGCNLMDDTRVGPKEHGSRNTDGYCEETAPAPWRGRVLLRRSGDECEWQEEELQGQCWGLGAMRPAGAASEEACSVACCKDDCEIWQWREDKGCFYTDKKGHCDPPDTKPYTGGRKVIPAGCRVKAGKIICEDE